MTMTGKIAGDITPDIESGKCRFGTQIRELSSVLKTYPGKICVLKLKDNPFGQRSDEDDSTYKKRISDLRTKATLFKTTNRCTWYQLNILQMLASVLPNIRWIRYFCPISKYWAMCSQIATEFYKTIDVLGHNVIPDDVLPQDFISDKDHQIKTETFEKPAIQILDK